MIRSPGSLMAEDVTVRCRVQKCKQNASPDEPWRTEDPTVASNNDSAATVLFQEMTCTMRNWDGHNRHRRRRRSDAHTGSSSSSNATLLESPSSSGGGPELLLTPLSHLRSSWSTVRTLSPVLWNEHTDDETTTPSRSRRRRASSTSACRISPLADGAAKPNVRSGRSGSSCVQLSHHPSTLPFTIPVEEILVVFVAPSTTKKRTSRLFLKTQTMGTFEVDCLSNNGHDVILTFLQASLLPDCIRDVHHPTDPASDMDHRHRAMSKSSSSSVTSCLDIDALQARHLQGRADAETWTEKLSRRVGLVVNNLTQLYLVTESNQQQTPGSSSSRGLGASQTSSTRLWCCCIGDSDVSTAIATPTAGNTFQSTSTRSVSAFQRYTAAASFPYTHTNTTDVAAAAAVETTTAELELDEATTDGSKSHISTPHRSTVSRQRTMGRIPSGLSVESDPDK